VDENTTLLFALSGKDGLRPFTLPVGRAEWKALVDSWRTALTEARHSETKEAATLSRLLLGPLERAGLLPCSRYTCLVLVPDGPLLDIPFAALPDGTGKRLVESYALSSSASLGALTWPANPRQPSASLLCAVDSAGRRGEARGSPPRDGFGPLRHARAEAKEVTRLFPGALRLAGARAREGVIKKQIGRYTVLHFATHGVLMASNGLLSWLMLAPEPPTSREDGRLEAREIAGLPLSAQLAVLSACETGRGQALGGEGLLGLAWAFRAAGCASVVASHWRVDDAATGRLMALFYRDLQAGRRKDAALQQAMLSVREAHAEPFFWAAFQIMGDTSLLTLPRV
jgi:CHAT domain-containing protein